MTTQQASREQLSAALLKVGGVLEAIVEHAKEQGEITAEDLAVLLLEHEVADLVPAEGSGEYDARAVLKWRVAQGGAPA